MKYSVSASNLPTSKKQATPVPEKALAAFLVGLYAIASGITPEFDFLGIPKVRITDLLLPLILLACSGPKRAGVKEFQLPFSRLMVQIMLWDLAALLIWGQAPLKPGIFYLAKRLIYFLVGYCTFSAVRDVKAWNLIVRLLVFASPILSFTVLRELSSNIAAGGILSTSEGMRASGIIANQQTSTALYIAMISSLALGAWGAFKDNVWRVGVLISIGTGCMAIFATGSRGGLACVVLAVLLTILQRPKQALGLFVVSLAVGSVAWTVTPRDLQARLAGIFPETIATIQGLAGDSVLPEAGSSSIADRAMNVQYAFREFIPKAHVLGLGAGWKILGAVDNFYLSEWMYHGLIGLVLFVLLIGRIAVGCHRIARSAEDPVEKGVASGAATAMAVMAMSGFQGDSFYLIRPMEALSVLLGLVAARRAISLSQEQFAPVISDKAKVVVAEQNPHRYDVRLNR